MKMVAASKLRRAQKSAEESRPYAFKMEEMISNIASNSGDYSGASKMLVGTGNNKTFLIIVMTANRGLCGGFNTNIIRKARNLIYGLLDKKNEVKIYTVGRKGRDNLKRDFSDLFVGHFEDFERSGPSLSDAEDISKSIISMFSKVEFDICKMIFSNFISAMNQEVSVQQLIPYSELDAGSSDEPKGIASYEYEPSQEEVLDQLLPRNLTIQLYKALLENDASEQGSRMTAMDNATRNAGEMIDKLTLTYNRTRQAQITTELIEIISGAEAL